jgi:hypothetical protein
MSGRGEHGMWKMQHIEVQLFENEEYSYGNAYTNRKTVVKEFIYELDDGQVLDYVLIKPRSIFDASILASSDRNNNVYVFDDDDFEKQTKCMEIRMKDEMVADSDLGYNIWRKGQKASAVKFNVPRHEMSEDMLSVRVFTGQIIQYITIAPERLKISDDEGNELGECVICMHNVKDIILQPCGHCCMCKMCYDKMQYRNQNCPMCRVPIRSTVTIYSYAMQGKPIHQSVQFESCNILSLLSNLKLLS